MLVLGIESSCDETAAAIVEDGVRVVTSVVANQDEIHAKFGGVVPELASRNHIVSILPVIQQTLKEAKVSLSDLGGIAVTKGPGLIGSLLVGLSTAKALAYAKKIPVVGVHHIEGHLTASLLVPNPPSFPLVGLVASGGHTSLYYMAVSGSYRLLSQTRDDAAGEAFDKVAKLLGLGFPGGPAIDRTSEGGNPQKIKFPRPAARIPDFSFSGLKTSVAYWVRDHGLPKGKDMADLVASFQEAVIDSLISKLFQAAEREEVSTVVVCGGVARNRRLRSRLEEEVERTSFSLHLAPFEFCTDNAAMIAAAGFARLAKGEDDGLRLNAASTLPISPT